MTIQNLFNKSVESIFKSHILPKNIAVALSGGVDSICLIHLLNNYVKSNNIDSTIYPITINHNLRPTSSLEIPIIRKELHKIGLSDTYLTESINLNNINGSFEEIARIERYKTLTKLCEENKIDHIFLAHHLDDQLETFILRLFSNSGIFGLGGMNPLSKSFINIQPHRLNLIRPMLNIQKHEILSYCINGKFEWVQDYSNFEEINQRNIVRKYLKDNESIKNNVLSTFRKCQALSIGVEKKVNELYDELQRNSKIIESDAITEIKLSHEQLQKNWDLTISRLLFKLGYRLSPSKNYHYSFHKLYKKFPISLRNDSFSLLQLQWDILSDQDGITINIKRQNLRTPIIGNITIPPMSKSEWMLFDNRFWMNFRNSTTKTQELIIKTLSKDDKLLFKQIPKNYKYSTHANLPVIIDNSTNKIIALPSFSSDQDIKCQLKENIYCF